MDREIVLVVLALWVCGPILLVSGLLPLKRERPAQFVRSRGEGQGLIWRAMLPTGIALAILLGWALQEPAAADESFRPFVYLAVLPILLIWTRAAIRAVRAFLPCRSEAPAFTIGLIRPRVFLSPLLVAKLDPEALRAVEAHEAAHARHWDPVRIWLARLVTDLTGPLPAATDRFERWLSALEIERDDEARVRGIDGADLAAAILVAVEMCGHPEGTHGAALLSHEEGLCARIERLLEPLPRAAVPSSRAGAWLRALVLVISLAVAAVLGIMVGDTAVKVLPGVISLPAGNGSTPL